MTASSMQSLLYDNSILAKKKKKEKEKEKNQRKPLLIFERGLIQRQSSLNQIQSAKHVLPSINH